MPRYNSRGDAANTFRGGFGIDGDKDKFFTYLTPKEVREYMVPMFQSGVKQPAIRCEYKKPAANPRDLVEAAVGGMTTPYQLGTGRSQSRGITHRTPDDTPTDGGRYHPRGFGATEHG